MAAIETETPSNVHQPVHAVAERLNDPSVAASLVTLLDNAELLSTLVLGLSGLMDRGEVIMDSVGEAVREVQHSGSFANGDGSSALPELGTLAGQMPNAAALLGHVLDSSMASSETIDLLSMVSDAAAEGLENAQSNGTTVAGVRGTLKAMKDPEVQRGLGLVIEIARSLGRRMDSAS